jgi:hypothetical protein
MAVQKPYPSLEALRRLEASLDVDPRVQTARTGRVRPTRVMLNKMYPPKSLAPSRRGRPTTTRTTSMITTINISIIRHRGG